MEEYRATYCRSLEIKPVVGLLVVVLVEEDGSHWGPEVLARAGHL